MLSVDPAPTPERIDELLAQGLLTDDIGLPNLGAGLINARKAIGAVDPNAPPLPPTLSVTPSSLAFGDVGTVAEVVASNAGDGTLDVTDVTASVTTVEQWLSVTPKSVDENRLGRYEIRVDRTGLEDEPGSYSGFVEFTSDGGTDHVDVLMEVAAPGGEPDAGRQYILLVDAATDQALTQVDVLADGSSVAYEFENIPSGEYLVISGTDLNNDRFICDPAEACGAYPVENAPETIVVDGAETGVDFLVAYRVGVPITTDSKGVSKAVRQDLRRRRIMR